MRLHLKFFGRFADIQSDGELDLTVAEISVQDLIHHLTEQDPEFFDVVERPGTRVVVNQNLATLDQALSNGDEVAFMSLVSGG